MMPAPVAYETGAVDPFARMEEAEKRGTIEILYATDRAPASSANPARQYGKQRGIKLRLGQALIRLGSAGMEWQELQAQSRGSNRPSMELLELDEFGPLWTTIPLKDKTFQEARESTEWGDEVRGPAQKFVAEVNSKLARSSWKEVVIFVPGVNTPFISPLHMMAQFSHFMGRDGVFIAYSWPARGNPLSYSKQVTTAGISVRNLRQLVLLLAEHSDAEKINLIGYSAGAPIMSNALLQLRLLESAENREGEESSIPIGSVIYVGADEDHQYFSNLYLDGFHDIADNITIYTSTQDLALRISAFFTTGSVRLGNVSGHLSENEFKALSLNSKTSVVDATNAKSRAGKGDSFAHGYWYGNSWVNQDVINLLRSDGPPGERGLIRIEASPIWTFPEDYPESVRELITP